MSCYITYIRRENWIDIETFDEKFMGNNFWYVECEQVISTRENNLIIRNKRGFRLKPRSAEFENSNICAVPQLDGQ